VLAHRPVYYDAVVHMAGCDTRAMRAAVMRRRRGSTRESALITDLAQVTLSLASLGAPELPLLAPCG
jgi:hypothetical protein